jgi:hypothetical protein
MADAPRARRGPRPSSSFVRFLLRRVAALVLLAVGMYEVMTDHADEYELEPVSGRSIRRRSGAESWMSSRGPGGR